MAALDLRPLDENKWTMLSGMIGAKVKVANGSMQGLSITGRIAGLRGGGG